MIYIILGEIAVGLLLIGLDVRRIARIKSAGQPIKGILSYRDTKTTYSNGQARQSITSVIVYNDRSGEKKKLKVNQTLKKYSIDDEIEIYEVVKDGISKAYYLPNKFSGRVYIYTYFTVLIVLLTYFFET